MTLQIFLLFVVRLNSLTESKMAFLISTPFLSEVFSSIFKINSVDSIPHFCIFLKIHFFNSLSLEEIFEIFITPPTILFLSAPKFTKDDKSMSPDIPAI